MFGDGVPLNLIEFSRQIHEIKFKGSQEDKGKHLDFQNKTPYMVSALFSSILVLINELGQATKTCLISCAKMCCLYF